MGFLARIHLLFYNTNTPMPDPIKRHPSLQPLSRDHHDGLLLCFKIREGIKRGVEPDRIKSYTDWFWENHLAPHFREEEESVFPLIGMDHPEVKIALEQHVRLKELFTGPVTDYETLRSMERGLEQHIRYEERTLFNTIQNEAASDCLAEAGFEHHRVPSCEVWNDPFWSDKSL
jgi:hemerythrin-like domain-containing protein